MKTEYSPTEQLLSEICNKIGACFSTGKQPLILSILFSYQEHRVVGTLQIPTKAQIAPWRAADDVDDIRPLTRWAQEKAEEAAREWALKLSSRTGQTVEPVRINTNVAITRLSSFDVTPQELFRNL